MSLKVLLADAGDILKSVLELSEEDQDIELIHVPSGTDALLRIKEIKPDVLIADVGLPGVDGYSLCEIVHTEDDLSGMRSILTGEEDVLIDDSRVEAATTDGYLPKPFNAEKLLRHLGLATEAESGDEAEEPASEGVFQMEVSDDMSFADVELGGEQGAEGELVLSGELEAPQPTEGEAQPAEAESSDDEEQEPESLDSILGLDEGKDDEDVDVDLGGEEEEVVPLNAAPAAPVQAGPFDTTEPEQSEERGALLEDEPAPRTAGDISSELASEEGRKLVEEIVKRLSDKVVREVAWEVVPDLAERIIKDTLEKITK